MIWMAPLLALALAWRMWPLAGCLATATGLTLTEFPGRYGGLVAREDLPVTLVVARDELLLAAVALALGWRPSGLLYAVPMILLGTLAFGALGVLLGGSLRAEVVLALANALWLALLLGGGIVVPADRLPGAAGDVVELLPSGALAAALDGALAHGAPPGWGPVAVLVAWAVAAGAVAVRTVRLS
jgi:ABC-2 type transport system permease protein